MRGVLKGLVKPTQFRQRTTRQWISTILGLLIIVSASGMAGGLMGYSVATGGQSPWMSTVAILPPDIAAETTLVDIGLFLEKNPSGKVEYGHDFNCVEDAILLARSAHWEGLPAEPARLMFEDGTGHLVLIFATADSGYVFVDPQSNQVINPKLGGYYMGKKITSIDRLVSVWTPIEWEEK